MRSGRVLPTSSPAAVFSFVTGSGADTTGRSQLAFARNKGEAENALLAAGFARVILCPAYIYPVETTFEPWSGPFIGIDLFWLTDATPSLLLRAARTLAPCGAALWRFEGWLPPRLVAGICGLSRLGLRRSCCTVAAVTIRAL
jgi:hypothetical protein